MTKYGHLDSFVATHIFYGHQLAKYVHQLTKYGDSNNYIATHLLNGRQLAKYVH